MNSLTHNHGRWIEPSARVRKIKCVPLSTGPCVDLVLAPMVNAAVEGSTFRQPAPKRNTALRDWLPCWFGGLSEPEKSAP